MAQGVLGSGGRFRAQQAPGTGITIPAAEVRWVRKGLGLGIENERELSLRHTQDLVIPVGNRGDEVIIPFEEVAGQGARTQRGNPRFRFVAFDDGSNVRAPGSHRGSGLSPRGARAKAQPGGAGLPPKSEVEVENTLRIREGSSGFPLIGAGEGVTLPARRG